MLRAMAILSSVALGASTQTAAPPSINEFRPSAHGFAFVNSFKGSPLPGPFAALGAVAGAPATFGLCGGMSFAAADFYLAQRAIPATRSIPTRGQPLYDYIYQRQTDSLGPSIQLAADFSRWMDLPDQGLTSAGAFTLGELPQMFDRLSNGEPVVLGLVLTDSRTSREPWHNHQVLATRAVLDEESPRGVGGCRFEIYDPNYPAADAARIEIQLTVHGLDRVGHDVAPVLGAQSERIVPGFRTRTVRGVFDMPYAPRIPPPDLK